MANLFIREYAAVMGARADSGGAAMPSSIPQEPAITDQVVPFSGEPGRSVPFNDETKFIAITADSTFSFVVGGDDVFATSNNFRILAGTVMYLGVGAGRRISAVVNV